MKLEPYETKVLLQEEFQTVAELQDLLDKAVRTSNQHPSVIHIDTANLGDFSSYQGQGIRFTLEAECLSDGSIVYNITLE